MTWDRIEELTDDIRRGLRIAHQVSEETQTVEEACADLVRLVRKAREERESALAEVVKLKGVLTETRNGTDSKDGLPCWCPSPTYAGRRPIEGPQHSVRCRICRSALGLGSAHLEESERAP